VGAGGLGEARAGTRDAGDASGVGGSGGVGRLVDPEGALDN
jgi:hypothetical protein